jgi:hypothetical protein
VSDAETLVHDAIAANVDLMAGPARIVDRVVASAGPMRRRRRRRRARVVATGAALTTAIAGGLGIARALGWRALS